MQGHRWECVHVGAGDTEEVIDVLAGAFSDYPVMRHVLAEAAGDAVRLRRLVGLFVGNRIVHGHPLLGVRGSDGRMVGAMTLTPPGEWPMPPSAIVLREQCWRELGERARERYEAFSAAVAPLAPAGRWWHVNMIGVLPGMRGRGVAAALLRRAHAIAAADCSALGVELTTEHARNLHMYGHLGYRVLGCAQVSTELSSWTLSRPHARVPAAPAAVDREAAVAAATESSGR